MLSTVTAPAAAQSARIRSTKRRNTVLASAAIAIALVGTLTACAPEEPKPTGTATASESSTPTPTPTPTVAPVMVPGGTAEQNKPFFDYIAGQAIEIAGGNPDGPAFINGLRANGFPVEGLEVTADITTVGVKADSIQFSFRASDACIVGQWGAVTKYVSMTAPVLSTGKCLVGETRTIDF